MHFVFPVTDKHWWFLCPTEASDIKYDNVADRMKIQWLQFWEWNVIVHSLFVTISLEATGSEMHVPIDAMTIISRSFTTLMIITQATQKHFACYSYIFPLSTELTMQGQVQDYCDCAGERGTIVTEMVVADYAMRHSLSLTTKYINGDGFNGVCSRRLVGKVVCWGGDHKRRWNIGSPRLFNSMDGWMNGEDGLKNI